MKDAFDLLVDEIEGEDPFRQVLSTEEESVDNLKAQLNDVLSRFDDKARKKEHAQIKAEFQATLTRELAKIKPVQNVIEKTIQTRVIEPQIIQAPAPKPQKIKEIIKEVRIEAPKDDRKLVEQDQVDELKGQIEDLKEKLRVNIEMMAYMGGSGVIGIPVPEGNPDNYVLTIEKGKPKWKASSGGGLSAGTFTVTNNTPDFTLDATGESVDMVWQVLATLIRKLQGEI